MSDTSTPTRSPDLVGDRYRLLDEIGRGGMASVHRAHDEVLGRDVAVKLLHGHLASDPTFLERFRREARAAAALSHPNVVAVYDWGETDDVAFMVLELVEGMSLREVLRIRGRVTPSEALALLGPAAGGLAAAHQQGLVHRDVKPENLLLGADGVVKVTDFGLARAASSTTQTFGADTLVGSPHYLCPEAVDGAPLSPASDVYALGIVLFECLTGRPPYQGESPLATALQHTSNQVPPPSSVVAGVPGDVDRVVQRATAVDPDDRYVDATEFALALAEAVPQGPAPVDLRTGTRNTVVLPNHATDTIVGLDTGRTTTIARRAVYGGDGSVPEPRRWPRRLLATVLALALLVGGGWVVYDQVLAPMTPVVSVLGADEAAARAQLEEAGFGVAVADPEHSVEVPAGQVLSQQPADGEARRGSTVTLVLSAGPRMLAVPAVADLAEDEAVSLLQGAPYGFEVTVQRVYDESIEAGRAVGTDPEVDASVAEASTVTLLVSQGREPIDVPNVVGEDRAAAVETLEAAGLEAKVASTAYHDDIPAGAVISQNPGPDSQLFRGQQVELVISDGPAPVTVPDVRGKSEEEARRILTGLGLQVEVFYVDTLNPFRRGVDDQDPAPDSQARRGDTVRIFVWR